MVNFHLVTLPLPEYQFVLVLFYYVYGLFSMKRGSRFAWMVYAGGKMRVVLRQGAKVQPL